jgi:hypothetical protein
MTVEIRPNIGADGSGSTPRSDGRSAPEAVGMSLKVPDAVRLAVTTQRTRGAGVAATVARTD